MYDFVRSVSLPRFTFGKATEKTKCLDKFEYLKSLSTLVLDPWRLHCIVLRSAPLHSLSWTFSLRCALNGTFFYFHFIYIPIILVFPIFFSSSICLSFFVHFHFPYMQHPSGKRGIFHSRMNIKLDKKCQL